MFDQEISVIVQHLIVTCLTPVITFFSNQEKDDGFYLKMFDQIKKFLFNTISNTTFPKTRAPSAYSISKS